MFNLYGPWFHKPYYNYYEMLKDKTNINIPKKIKNFYILILCHQKMMTLEQP